MAQININDSEHQYVSVNRKLIKALGYKEALLLCELIGEHNYWDKEKKLNNGWFYSTAENIEKQIGIKEKSQKNIIDKLVKVGLIEREVKGMPKKRFFKINQDKIKDLVNAEYLEWI